MSHDGSPAGWLGRVSVSFRLILTVTIAIAVALIPLHTWWLAVLECVVVIVIVIGSAISLRALVSKLLMALPVILLMGLAFWLSHGNFRPAIEYLCRATLSLSVMITFALSVSLDQLLLALDRLRVPRLFLFSLSFMARFASSLRAESSRIQQAASARLFAPTRSTLWLLKARTIGTLFLRSLRRAEQVHSAMLARGWSGTEPIWDENE